ncbi:uncharacterized protein LOC109835226 [Asparagus officinalis]|uniref:uncharacterized protein LOC109835226 n=1 Tax=Asparagus officinalis TaxID=4686 RepID=UPI00098E2569|nr:uncharacterized protein LOC109835226 [Asparagus officinalis]
MGSCLERINKMEARGNGSGSSKEDALIQSEDTEILDYDYVLIQSEDMEILDYDWDQTVGDLDWCRQIEDDNISETNMINLDNHNDKNAVDGDGEGGNERKKKSRGKAEPNDNCAMRYNFGSDYADSDNLKSPLKSDDEQENAGYSEFSFDDGPIPQFEVGQIFSDLKTFKNAVKDYAMKGGYSVRYKKNEPKRQRLICWGDCKWQLYASAIHGEDQTTLQVKRYDAKHSCIRTRYNTQCTTKWVAENCFELVLRRQDTRPVDIMEDIHTRFNFQISKSTACRARALCLEKINGSEVQQFQKLYDYCNELVESNPGTIVKVKKVYPESENEARFQRIYICFSALRDGFKNGCRPFIGLDACHLRGNMKGVILTACGVDGNNCMYPFAFAIVEGERAITWEWFMELLVADIGSGDGQGWTYMSDKQKGLIRAVGDSQPEAAHRFCVRHLYQNFKESFKVLHFT